MNMNITEEQVRKYIAENVSVKVKLYRKGWLLAQAEIQLPGQIIRGCTVKKSDYPHEDFGEPIWIEPPCYRSKKGNYSKIVYFEEELWKIIEKKIFETYKEKVENSEEINLDDIPL